MLGVSLLLAVVAAPPQAPAQAPGPATAQAPAPGPAAAGRWKTIDDKTGEPRSIVVIEEKNGVFEGRIEKIFFRPDEPVTDPECSKCTDARKGQKIIGLTFLTGLTRDGLDYAGGEILDPANGKVYRAKLKLSADGAKLEVRGYIGISLFGRSQTWLRE
jgi:uncharacterized protein (DUF2147 family)